MCKAKVIRSIGSGVTGRVIFEAPGIHGYVACEEMQTDLGYHPAGYGGPDNLKTLDTDDGKVTRWECSASCD
jgi:hypothetical protein